MLTRKFRTAGLALCAMALFAAPALAQAEAVREVR